MLENLLSNIMTENTIEIKERPEKHHHNNDRILSGANYLLIALGDIYIIKQI